MGAGVLNTYPDLLPVTNATPIITMGEGDTPLVRSNRLGRELGCTELYFKLEGCNPTGSFKDVAWLWLLLKHWKRSPKLLCRSEEHTSELQPLVNFVCRLLLEKKK